MELEDRNTPLPRVGGVEVFRVILSNLVQVRNAPFPIVVILFPIIISLIVELLKALASISTTDSIVIFSIVLLPENTVPAIFLTFVGITNSEVIFFTSVSVPSASITKLLSPVMGAFTVTLIVLVCAGELPLSVTVIVVLPAPMAVIFTLFPSNVAEAMLLSLDLTE